MCKYLNPDNALTVAGRRRMEEKNLNLAKQTADEMKKLVILATEAGLIEDFTAYSYGSISISFRPQKAMLFVTYCKCGYDYLESCVCRSKPLSEEEYLVVANKYRITPADITDVRDRLSAKIMDELAS